MAGLYEARLGVLSQAAQERQQAIRSAFAQVLVKITGNREIAASEAGAGLVENAGQYMRQYRYERDEADGSQRIKVVFDEKVVNEALWNLRLPVWGKTRPATLAWVAVQDFSGRYLLDPNEPQPILTLMNQQAEARAIPLLLPLMDLTDQVAVSVGDVWANFGENIRTASNRYQAEAILVGRLAMDAMGQWQGRWSLYQGEEVTTWESRGESGEALAMAAIDSVADVLAGKYAHVAATTGDDSYELMVVDVENVRDYVRLSRYLASLSSVAKMEVARIEPESVTFRLKLRGDARALDQAIALGSVLARSSLISTDERHLNYRLRP